MRKDDVGASDAPCTGAVLGALSRRRCPCTKDNNDERDLGAGAADCVLLEELPDLFVRLTKLLLLLMKKLVRRVMMFQKPLKQPQLSLIP